MKTRGFLHSLLLLLFAGASGRSYGVHGLAYPGPRASAPAPAPAPAPALRPRSIATANKEHFGANPNANQLFAAPPMNAAAMDRSAWRVTCDSEQAGSECGHAIDGNNATFWHTEYAPATAALPHSITLDLGAAHAISGLSALPRQDGSQHGWIARHEVALSLDAAAWHVVALGNWPVDDLVKFANFEPQIARYVRLTANSEIFGNPWTSLAELNVFDAPAQPAAAAAAAALGSWGPTINFPTVPVAAMVNPLSGKVTVWSAYAYNNYIGSSWDRVFTAVWDPSTNDVEPDIVDNTDHDMFCPGVSIAGSGSVVVSGGNSKYKTTMYDFAGERWVPTADMRIPRGYQSSATCSDGRVFTVGGSWSGGEIEPKDGEIFDPVAGAWTALPNAKVAPMLTQDAQGVYRADNHAWLFGWSNGSVFQAGPSTAMNWYSTDDADGGGVVAAGKRTTAAAGDDPDSMCGIAVMYDAPAGKILTAGGAPSYQQSAAHANAHIITIDGGSGADSGSAPDVRLAGGGAMSYARSFATAVVLPGGKTFITGGQSYAIPFEDSTSQLTPELYDPATDRFSRMAPNTIPRNYHSVALLMPDARVFSAGGGLCGDCDTNHFDGQIYTPPYLFDASTGAPVASRPVIVAATLGGSDRRSIDVTTAGPVASAADLIRVGTSTHTVNTDQRRVPLNLTPTGADNSYSAVLPADPGVLLPGYWMLFVMSEEGVPSVAKIIDLTTK